MGKVWVLMEADREGEPGPTLAVFTSLEAAKACIEAATSDIIKTYWKAKTGRYEGEYHVGWITSRPLVSKLEQMYYIVPLTPDHYMEQDE